MISIRAKLRNEFEISYKLKPYVQIRTILSLQSYVDDSIIQLSVWSYQFQVC